MLHLYSDLLEPTLSMRQNGLPLIVDADLPQRVF